MAHWRSAFKYANHLPEVVRCLLRARRPVAMVLLYLRLREWPGDFRIVLRNRACIDAHTYEDLVTAWIIFFRREYRIPPGAMTIVDIGANTGCFTVMAAWDRRESRIVCVEPYPPTFARLAETIELNRLSDRTTLWQVGIAARSEIRLIPHGDWPSQSLGMLPSGSTLAAATAIDCVTLDEILQRACAELRVREVDFVKMDIEGAEHESLRAVTRAGLRRTRFLALEYHPNEDKRGLFDAVVRCGFRLERDAPINPAAGVAHFTRVSD